MLLVGLFGAFVGLLFAAWIRPYFGHFYPMIGLIVYIGFPIIGACCAISGVLQLRRNLFGK